MLPMNRPTKAPRTTVQTGVSVGTRANDYSIERQREPN